MVFSFGFYLTLENGILVYDIRDSNDKHSLQSNSIHNKLNFVKVLDIPFSDNNVFYTVTLNKFSIFENHYKFVNDIDVMIDTGTTFLYLPDHILK